MNASRRYLPLSLMLLLAASVGSANAGSFLDPYSHIKAPAGTAPKKKFLQQQEPAIVPQADEVAQPTTYVTMPMGHLAEEGAEKKPSGGGLLGKTLSPFKAASSSVAKSGKFLSNGAKASGGMAKKSGTLIGTGFKGDKKGSASNKIASKPKAEKNDDKNKNEKKNHSPSRVASVDDWYTKEAEKAIAHKDMGKGARDLVKQDPSKASGHQTAFLEPKGGKKLSISSKLNPFNKFKKPNDKNNSQVDIRPASGFADGAANPDEEVLAELEREKAARLAAKELREGTNEPFTPIVATPEPAKKKGEQVATNAKNGAKPEKSKKSKFGLNIAKLKPGMPAFGKGKKKDQPASIAAAPKKDKNANPKNNELDKLTEVEPVAKIDPAGEEDLAPGASSMAFTTGDKAIDAATPKGKAAEKKNDTVVAKKPAKKGKFGGVASLSKFNFMNKKKQPAPSPQTATKSDAPKQM